MSKLTPKFLNSSIPKFEPHLENRVISYPQLAKKPKSFVEAYIILLAYTYIRQIVEWKRKRDLEL